VVPGKRFPLFQRNVFYQVECSLHLERFSGPQSKNGLLRFKYLTKTLENVHVLVLGGMRGCVVSCVDQIKKPFPDTEHKVSIN
jgi:hypothetical protein